jgi:hypothetical protein
MWRFFYSKSPKFPILNSKMLQFSLYNDKIFTSKSQNLVFCSFSFQKNP